METAKLGGKPGAEPSWHWDRMVQALHGTRGRQRLGEENIRQRWLLFYFLRYDPEEGQTVTFYSGARKRRLAAAETDERAP